MIALKDRQLHPIDVDRARSLEGPLATGARKRVDHPGIVAAIPHPQSAIRNQQSLPALSVHQLWAWAILHAGKRWENRSWRTRYRGPLVIHAATSRKSLPASLELLEELGIAPPPIADLPFGHLVGIVDLVDCVPIADVMSREMISGVDDDWASGPWCWRLENPRPLDNPIRCKGQQQLFKVQVAA